MKIIIDNKIPFIQGVFEPYATVEYLDASKFSNPLIRTADALVVRTRTLCNAALLDKTNIKFIASATIGYDHIDADFCQKNNIQWTNAEGCNSTAVEQYVTCAMLALAHKHEIDLREKTMGIVGLGNVGKRVAKIAQILGMKVLCNDPPRAQVEGAKNFTSLEQLLAQSDLISLHTPLSSEGKFATYHLADTKFFAQLKPQAIFINTSRGEVVDEDALKKSILNKTLLACALDVWENEPNINPDLLNLVDIATPHIAGYSLKGKSLATQMAVQAVGDFFQLPLAQWHHPNLGKPPKPLIIDAKQKNLQTLLSQIAQQTYNIYSDDARLRLSPLDGEKLRSNYLYRQDFSAFNISLKNASQEQQEKITQIFSP
ncbi:MAG: 4-phosphoerythronate dehydrogenase [Bacteroidales bacterium]